MSTNLIKQISRRFPGESRRDFKKNPGHVCLASASFGGDTKLSVSPPQPNRNLAERHKLPHRGPWRSPRRKRVLVHLELERTHLMVINFVFLRQIFIHIFMTGNQCGYLRHLIQKFPGGPIKFQKISRRVFKFQEISRSCRHPGT